MQRAESNRENPDTTGSAMRTVDVVVVSFNSRERLHTCVAPLAGLADVDVIVVDNASSDDSLEVVRDLAIRTIQLDDNGGFGHGCNVGWHEGQGDLVLFLNPDAEMDEQALKALARTFDDPQVGAAAPRIIHEDGSLDFSQRRFPRLRSTYAQALFLHRVFPSAPWTDELVREPVAYESAGAPDWVSGACVMVRRDVLEEIGGFDEGFFLYCEDIDLCRRISGAGHTLMYTPEATVRHVGGASAPRAGLLPVLAASRIRYARKHRSRAYAFLERAGIALGSLSHLVVSSGGGAARRGHASALRLALSRH
jgi:N-acetylglucosaminyl-diphospho-decaprenol L-rhamnosyltransferase